MWEFLDSLHDLTAKLEMSTQALSLPNPAMSLTWHWNGFPGLAALPPNCQSKRGEKALQSYWEWRKSRTFLSSSLVDIDYCPSLLPKERNSKFWISCYTFYHLLILLLKKSSTYISFLFSWKIQLLCINFFLQHHNYPNSWWCQHHRDPPISLASYSSVILALFWPLTPVYSLDFFCPYY